MASEKHVVVLSEVPKNGRQTYCMLFDAQFKTELPCYTKGYSIEADTYMHHSIWRLICAPLGSSSEDPGERAAKDFAHAELPAWPRALLPGAQEVVQHHYVRVVRAHTVQPQWMHPKVHLWQHPHIPGVVPLHSKS